MCLLADIQLVFRIRVCDLVPRNVVNPRCPDANRSFGEDLHPVPEGRGFVRLPAALRGVRLNTAPERTLVGEHVAHLHRDIRVPVAPLQRGLNGEQLLVRDAPVRYGGPKQQPQYIRERLDRKSVV